MKKISVIIPCYNVERWIDRCMTSIIRQTIGMEPLEVICIDDASTDNTWKKLQKYERRFPENVVLICQKENQKQGTARNIGLRYASADWVAFVDADDWLEPDYFEILYEAVREYGCDVVSCSMGVDSSELLSYFSEKEREERADHYALSNTIERKKDLLIHRQLGDGPCAKIIRKALLEEYQIGFPERLAYEDSYWITLLHMYVDRAYVIGKKLYHWFINPYSTIHAKNETYHIDYITVQMIKRQEYDRRKIWKEYREELEYDLLYDALCFMKLLVLRFDHPPFSYYQLQKRIIQQWVPDYRLNPYIGIFQGIAGLFLEALYLPVNREEFSQFIETARQYYGL